MFENHLKMSHLNFQAQKFPSFSVDSKIEYLYEISSVFIRIYGKWDFFFAILNLWHLEALLQL